MDDTSRGSSNGSMNRLEGLVKEVLFDAHIMSKNEASKGKFEL